MSDVQNEPSVDDILASIRQIISDEDADNGKDMAGGAEVSTPAESPFHAHEAEGPKGADTSERMDISAVLSQFAAQSQEQAMPESPPAAMQSSPMNGIAPAAIKPSAPAKTMDDMEVVDFTATQAPTPPPAQTHISPQPIPTPAPMDKFGDEPPKADILTGSSNMGVNTSKDDNYFIVMDDASKNLAPAEPASVFPTVSDEVSVEFPDTSARPSSMDATPQRDTSITDSRGLMSSMVAETPKDSSKDTDKSRERFVNFFSEIEEDNEADVEAAQPTLEDSASLTDNLPPQNMEATASPAPALPPEPTASAPKYSGSHPEFEPLAAPEVSSAAATTIGNLFAELEVSGDKTIEAVIRELLRPLLKEWLDNNLASIVDEKVESEIRRIARLAR